ncbi:MAG: hypothetical protein GY757_17115 [bacterium]|nr:hypothetical protein [bacterium]
MKKSRSKIVKERLEGTRRLEEKEPVINRQLPAAHWKYTENPFDFFPTKVEKQPKVW